VSRPAAVVESDVLASAGGVVAEPDSVGEAVPVADDADVVAEAQPTPEAAAPEVEPEPEVRYVHLVDEDDIPLTWDPVPVPRPTYTMKARAERPEVPPAAVTPDPEPVALPEDPAYDERRVAGA
jgi:hypothetical protein